MELRKIKKKCYKENEIRKCGRKYNLNLKQELKVLSSLTF